MENNEAKDPICGMEVDEKVATKKGLVSGSNFFCSKDCLDKFNKGPSYIQHILSVILVAIAVTVGYLGYMLQFMGVAFLILAALKLIDIKGFANMFQQYDLLAKRSKPYSLVYPFIELTLGILFISQTFITTAAIITIIVMTLGTIGIANNLMSKNKVKCACLGSKIKIPLTTFTLVEDIVMLVMGIMILVL